MFDLIWPSFPAGRFGLGLLVLRLFVGFAFIRHGSGKLNDIPGFAAEYHVPQPMALAAMLTQLSGGALLLLGLLTPLAALGVTGTVAVATVFLIKEGQPFINPKGHSWENSAFYVAAGLALALLGPGRYSLDAYLLGR
jgi:putative oxidoreductase